MPEPPQDSDTLDIDVRPVARLAGRAAALATVARRGVIEIDPERSRDERETDRFDLYSWARAELAEHLTADERRLLATPAGELDDPALLACGDALISAAAIAWSLGIVTTARLPDLDTASTEEQVMAWAPEPWASVAKLAQTMSVRDDETIASERERWELWYWRAVEGDPGDEGFEDVIAAIAQSGLISTSGNDLASDRGVPFRELSPDEQDRVASLAELRLHALNWVCGFGASWDDVPRYPD